MSVAILWINFNPVIEVAKYPFRQVFYNQFFTPSGPSPWRLKNWSINTCLQWYFALPARRLVWANSNWLLCPSCHCELLLLNSCIWWSKSCNKAMVRTPWQGQVPAHLSRYFSLSFFMMAGVPGPMYGLTDYFCGSWNSLYVIIGFGVMFSGLFLFWFSWGIVIYAFDFVIYVLVFVFS